MDNNCRTLIIKFNEPLAVNEIPLFRGAVASKVPPELFLFHNHLGESQLRYRYPLIQYKRINGNAAIVCVGEGTETIGEFFSQGNFTFELGRRTAEMEVENIVANRTLIQAWDTEFKYSIRKWLPLSSENYAKYRTLDGVVAQCAFLQDILTGNILSLCKGLGIAMENRIQCVITNMMDTRTYMHKGVKMMGFDLEFKSNVSLPNYIGLGKGVSVGFGTVMKLNN